jgi:hypothetical protein
MPFLHINPAYLITYVNPKKKEGVMRNEVKTFQTSKGCVTLWPLPFTLKSNLKANGNSNISPSKNTIFKKFSKRNQNPSRYYNSITHLKFQHKLNYQLSKILI